MSMEKQQLEAQEQLMQAALKEFQTAHDMIFKTTLTTVGFISSVQEQTQEKMQEWLEQSNETRKLNLEKVEALIKETIELHNQVQKNVQEWLASASQPFASSFPAGMDQAQ
jgi:chaperonin cofactor prefoldin